MALRERRAAEHPARHKGCACPGAAAPPRLPLVLGLLACIARFQTPGGSSERPDVASVLSEPFVRLARVRTSAALGSPAHRAMPADVAVRLSPLAVAAPCVCGAPLRAPHATSGSGSTCSVVVRGPAS